MDWVALNDGTGGSQRWTEWLSAVDRVALSAWNTQKKKNYYKGAVTDKEVSAPYLVAYFYIISKI